MSNLIHYINQDNTIDISKEEIFQRVLNRTFKEEGGYVDNKHKIEIPTNMGIRQDTLDRFRRKHVDEAKNFPTTVKKLSKEQVSEIYRKDYFEPYNIGEIKHKALQETMFDSFVNHSPQGPAIWAQQAINQNTSFKVEEDGIFGPKTISALNHIDNENDVKNVNNSILDKRLEALREQQKDQNSLFSRRTVGIPNRIDRFRIK